MTDNERIAALRRQAEGMGGKCYPCPSGQEVINFGGEADDNFTISYSHKGRGLDTAATLLGALDPDAVVVEIKHDCSDCTIEAVMCDYSEPKGRPGYYEPGPRCPGPCDDDHEWVLVKRRKVK